MRKTAVIMAGGRGERFWPQSRVALPKQFLSLTRDGKTMLQLTAERLAPLVEEQDIYVVTGEDYCDLVARQLPGIPKGNILCEPMPRNTAPAIAFAAAVITARHRDALMLVMPSDHVVKNLPLFTDTFELAAAAAEAGETLVTVGIAPTYAETGYGYIKLATDGEAPVPGVYRVDRFVEKPDYETAKKYYEDGSYLWNSGMFVWKASSFLANLERHLPSVAACAAAIRNAADTPAFEDTVKAVFQQCESISVDYGVMEKAQQVYTLPGSFGWDDVGSWSSLERINELDRNRNLCKGNVLAAKTDNSILVSGGRLVAAVGVRDVIVVDTGDAVLVCNKENAQDVKEIVNQLKEKGLTEYL